MGKELIPDLVVQNVDIETVIPYDNNPRNITQQAVDALAESIKDYGWQQPIVVDKDMVIIVGHTRLKAAYQLGCRQVPVVIAHHLTEEQARAYRIIDNKSGEKSTWNFDLLKIELESLDLSTDVINLNFSQLELHTILDSGHEESDEEKEEDEEKKENKRGARNAKERHTIMLNANQFRAFVECAAFLKEHEPDITDGEVMERVCTEWLKAQ